MRCPKCSSENVQVHYDVQRQGFSGGKGCCGWILMGPIGLLCGLCGKNNVKSEDKYWVCNNCGAKFTDAEAEIGEKRYQIDMVLNNAETNLGSNPKGSDLIRIKNDAIKTLKSKLTPDELHRFVFSFTGVNEKSVQRYFR